MTGPLTNGEDFAGLDEDLTIGNCGAHLDGIACGRGAGHAGKHAAHCSERMHEIVEWEARGPGRPPKAPEDVRKMRGLRFSDKEWAAVKADARRLGTTASELVRGRTAADHCPHCGAWRNRCNLDRGGRTLCAVSGTVVE